MVIDLEVLSFVLNFINKNFKLNSWTVFRVDELVDNLVEFGRALIKINKQVSELSENKLFPLSVLKEKECYKIFWGELYKFLSSHNFLLAKVVFKHESVHWGVQLNFVVSFSFKSVFSPENFNNLFRKINVGIFSQIILIDMLTNFKIKLNVLNVFKLFFVFCHCAADQAVLFELFLNSVLGDHQCINSFMNFGIRIIVMELSFYSLFRHLSSKLNWSHVRKPLFLRFFSFQDHLI